jgi:hypothetical protein
MESNMSNFVGYRVRSFSKSRKDGSIKETWSADYDKVEEASFAASSFVRNSEIIKVAEVFAVDPNGHLTKINEFGSFRE